MARFSYSDFGIASNFEIRISNLSGVSLLRGYLRASELIKLSTQCGDCGGSLLGGRSVGGCFGC